MLKIYFDGNQWRAFEAHDSEALSEAAKNSLPVLNEEVISKGGLTQAVEVVPNLNALYDWQGTYKYETQSIKQYGITNSSGYILTPPAPVKEKKSILNPDYHIKVLKERITESEKQYQSLRSELEGAREKIRELEDKIEHLEYGGEIFKPIPTE
jgi:hypothetical protein